MKDSLTRAIGVFNSSPLRVSHRGQDQGLRQIIEEEEETNGIPLANSLLIGKKSTTSIPNLADSHNFMTAPSILKSKRAGQNNIEGLKFSFAYSKFDFSYGRIQNDNFYATKYLSPNHGLDE